MTRRGKAGRPAPAGGRESLLRVIGGHLRGRKFAYSGDERTRPMKERVREAVFNLVGPAVVGTHVIDLFAGSGALTWEALSRGAVSATLIERHFPTARVIHHNAELLGVQDRVELITGNTLVWARQPGILPKLRWLVFCAPPYALYVSDRDAMLGLIGGLADRAPAGSLIVVECDARFDTQLLPAAEQWDVRRYAPAVVALRTIRGVQ